MSLHPAPAMLTLRQAFKPAALLLAALFQPMTAPSLCAAAPQAELVKDIHTGLPNTATGIRLSATLTPATGSAKALLVLADQEHGEELWLSNGSTSGDSLIPLKDIFPGRESSDIRELISAGGRGFFLADDGVHGEELWTTDGTPSGTRIVADLTGAPGTRSNIRAIKPFKNGVVFVAESDLHPTALWFSDGTAAGTRALKVLAPNGNDVPDLFANPGWVEAGGSFYFAFQPAPALNELWKTDGTLAGTTLVKALPAPAENLDKAPVLIGAVGTQLLFQLPRDDARYDLMKSNGTAKGTVRITTLQKKARTDMAVTADGKTYFFAGEGYDSHSPSPWFTDGTAKGTKELSGASIEMLSGEIGGKPLSPPCILEGKLVTPLVKRDATRYSLGAYDLISGEFATLLNVQATSAHALVSEGALIVGIQATSESESGIFRIHGTPGQKETLTTLPYCGGLTRLNGLTLFAFQGANGDSDSLHPAKLAVIGNSLYSIAFLPAAGTGSNPQELRVLGDRLFFSADDGTHGRELWESDGTPAGTVLSLDARPGPLSSNPRWLTSFQNHLFFSAILDPDAFAIQPTLAWRTPAGDLGSRSPVPSAELSDRLPANLYAGTNRLFFTDRHASGGLGLWATDTPFQNAATSPVTALHPRYESDFPTVTAEMDGWLYFTAPSAIGARDSVLWRMSLAPGSVPEEVSTGVISASLYPQKIGQLIVRPPTPGAVYPAESVLFFTGGNANTLYLCRNQQPVEYLRSSTAPMSPLRLSGGSLILTSVHLPPTQYPHEVVRYDGNNTFAPLTPAYSCKLLTTVGDTVYYSGQPSVGEYTLESVKKDGTGRRILFTQTGDPQSLPLHTVGDALFFTRHTTYVPFTANPWTLWMTRGTPETTVEIPGSLRVKYDVILDNAAVLNDHLYFTATHPEAGRELHALALNNWLTVTDVTDAENPVTLTEDATVDLGALGTSRVLRFSNDGPLALPALSLTGLSSAPFTADITAIPSLAPGESANVTVSFAAFNSGTYNAEMRIFLAGVNHHTHTHRLLLKGRKVNAGDAPVITWTSPRTWLLAKPETFTLQTAVTPEPDTAPVWHQTYNAPLVEIPGGPFPPLPSGSGPTGAPPGSSGSGGIPNPTDETVGTGTSLTLEASPGVYTLHAGPTISDPAYVATFTPLSPARTVAAGGTFWLSAEPWASDGSGQLSVQWLRNGAPLALVDRLATSTGNAALIIHPVLPQDAGEYSCILTYTTAFGTVTRHAGSTVVTVLHNPVVEVPEIGLTHFVGQTVNYTIPANQAVDRFTIKGLPPGLTASPAGVITGVPLKALPIDPATGLPRPYLVTVSATNAGGTGPVATVKWHILPPLPSGTYEGLLGRMESPDYAQNLGSRVKLVFAPTGGLTGTLLHRGRTYRFTGGTGLTVGVVPNVAGSLVRIDIPQAKPLPPFQLFITPSDVRSGLTLDTRDGNGASGFLQKQITPQVAAAVYCHPLYTARLTPTENTPAPSLPSGIGFLTATVSKKGNVNWKGKLADGTAVTGSGLWTGSPGDIALPIHLDLYKATGALHGWLTFTPRLQLDSGDLSSSLLGGLLEWSKAAQPETSKERVYKAGFPAHNLAIQGQEYKAPAKGQIILGLPSGGDNARLTLSGPNVPDVDDALNGSRTQVFTLLPTHKPVNFGQASSFAPLKTLTVSPATGTYKGTLLFTHENPKLNRTVAFEGVIIAPDGPAPGFFLLPDLPAQDQPASALKTTPVQSGKIEITPPSLP